MPDQPTALEPLPAAPAAAALAAAGDWQVADAPRASHFSVLTDAQLIECFIQEACTTKASIDSYRSNLRRLAWFCRDAGLRTVREFHRSHWIAYEEFLHAPPAHAVMEPTSANKQAFSYAYDDPRWRPFRTGLSDASVRHAQTIAKGFFLWLADPAVGVIEVNPVATARAKKKAAVSATVEGVSRFIPEEMLPFVDEGISAMYAQRDQAKLDAARREAHVPADADADEGQSEADEAPAPKKPARPASETHRREREMVIARARWVVRLGLLSGLRASEIAKSTTAMIHVSKGAFSLHVTRKGGKKSKLPILDEVLAELEAYMAACGHDWSRMRRTGSFPLVMGLRNGGKPKAVSRGQVWGIVKDAMEAASKAAAAAGELEAAQHLAAASTHWLRHSFATSLLDAGAEITVVRDLLDHGNIATTNRYVHTRESQLRGGLSQLAARRAGSAR
jgi:site-specific recombinase XerD